MRPAAASTPPSSSTDAPTATAVAPPSTTVLRRRASIATGVTLGTDEPSSTGHAAASHLRPPRAEQFPREKLPHKVCTVAKGIATKSRDGSFCSLATRLAILPSSESRLPPPPAMMKGIHAKKKTISAPMKYGDE